MKDYNWQLSNFELSKRLKELGIEQESLRWWIQFKIDDKEKKWNWSLDQPAGCYVRQKISAFTVAELGEMLPKGSASSVRKNGKWKCVPPIYNRMPPNQTADTEANARAKMLIYLLEHNLIQK